jgi:dipeptidyl aminopeptidase/acylaminoacyl peptidase
MGGIVLRVFVTSCLVLSIQLVLPIQPVQPLTAQAKRSMTMVDLIELSRGLNPQLSPDGKTLIYYQSHADWKADRPIWNMFRQDVGGAAQQITFNEAGDFPAALSWSPDGKKVLFVRGGQVWLMPADGGEPAALTHHNGIQPAPAPAWSPDGKSIYFVAEDQPTAEERERVRVRDDIKVVDADFKQSHLWKVTVATGAEQQITSGNFTIKSFRLSRDGTRIAMQRGITPSEGDLMYGEVWVSDADGGNAIPVTRNRIAEYDPELSPDNSQVLFTAEANAKLEQYYNMTLFVVPAKGGTPEQLVPDLAVDAATWAPDGKSIIAAVNLGVHSEFFSIDVASRKAKQLTDGKHYIVPGWSVFPAANRVVWQFDEPTRFGDVWSMPIDGGAPPARLTGIFDRMNADFAIPTQERVEWRGADGTTIEGVLFVPPTARPATGYPLVIQMHGGPKDSDKFGAGAGLTQFYPVVLASKGYAVLRPNYRGSTGYGNTFFRGIVGGYFKHQPTDILTGVDELVKRGVADPNRLVLMGWSAGAHLTNKLITMTPRFKAASSGAGISNWVSAYAQTDARNDRTVWFGGTPWEKDAFQRFWAESPLKDVANVTTPTLFVVGEGDTRIPMWQPIEMYRALRSIGVPTDLVVAPRENHGWGGLHHLLSKANHELEWFDKYAMGRTYVAEKAPDQK